MLGPQMGPMTLPLILVDGRYAGMTVKIDIAGRVVIPKPLRERLGLKPGSDLELSEGPDGLILKPLRHKAPAMVRERGLWVHQGVPTEALDIGRVIEQVREERERNIRGF